MKINESIKNTAGLGIEKAGVEKANAAKVEAEARQKAEKSQTGEKSSGNVTLSPLSAKLQTLETKVKASNVFDAEKVDAIKSAIAGGQFSVSSEKVADGLIETVKDLLTSRFA
ncbi:MAG: flagellar biosynthesis anti-sigma factor FlgM [Methylotenera sp.]|uniref:flagellar biosynthesis anti-sigma factor FlgM n=1 Tax=Methylotenera sp. TaxID=2051956 RepID=UPI000D481076|nr:flagellar biosynthesis anti-sigma factor FlgM [Methylotenera sp.]PPC82631.1 MAG: flagellar biosynthesis anti-sigma factor FlgM [Methylotenera sp.]